MVATVELLRSEDNGMSHEIAKLLLEHAENFLERTEAIKTAMSLGMPLSEIEDYLDWLDSMRGRQAPPAKNDRGSSDSQQL